MIILLIIILLIIYYYNLEQFSNHGRCIIQALDYNNNENTNCIFKAPDDSEIAFPSSTLLEDELENCNVFGSYRMDNNCKSV